MNREKLALEALKQICDAVILLGGMKEEWSFLRLKDAEQAIAALTDEQPQKVGGDAEILYEIAAELDEVDAKGEWPEDAPGLAEQLRDIARRLAEQAPEPSGTMTWQKAAMLAGERLGKTGPDNYYSLTPEQWLEWISTPEPNRAVVSRRAIGLAGMRAWLLSKDESDPDTVKALGAAFDAIYALQLPAPQPTAEIEEAVNGLVSAAQNLCDVADIPDPQLWSDAHERTLAALDKLKEAKHGQ